MLRLPRDVWLQVMWPCNWNVVRSHNAAAIVAPSDVWLQVIWPHNKNVVRSHDAVLTNAPVGLTNMWLQVMWPPNQNVVRSHDASQLCPQLLSSSFLIFSPSDPNQHVVTFFPSAIFTASLSLPSLAARDSTLRVDQSFKQGCLVIYFPPWFVCPLPINLYRLLSIYQAIADSPSLPSVPPILANKPPNHDLSIERFTYISKQVMNCYQLSATTTQIEVKALPVAPNSNNKKLNPSNTYRHLIRCLGSAKGLVNVSYHLNLLC